MDNPRIVFRARIAAQLLACLLSLAITAALISLATTRFLDPPSAGAVAFDNTGYYQSAPTTLTFVRGGQPLCTVEPPNVDGGIPRVPPEAVGGCCKLVAVPCEGEAKP